MSQADLALRRFADRHAFDVALLAGDDPYRIEGAGPEFDGAVRRLRVVEGGRLGNAVLQLLHASLLARLLDCREIEMFPLPAIGLQAAAADAPHGIRIRDPAIAGAPGAPTLVGSFFHVFHFGSALGYVEPEALDEVLATRLRPLLGPLLEPGGTPPEDEIVAHFRGGDIFAERGAHPLYVQPPAQFYTLAIARARAKHGVRRVRLVHEDHSNPALDVVAAWCRAEGLPTTLQSSSLSEDARCLARATHLVAAFSTLTEAMALLSTRVRSYAAFRHVESHRHLHRRAQPMLLDALVRRGAEVVVFVDGPGDYVQPGAWTADDLQRALIRDYPAERLIVLTGDAARQREAGLAAAEEIARAATIEREASRARWLLLEAERRIEALEAQERSLRQSTSWRLTAPLRVVSALLRRRDMTSPH